MLIPNLAFPAALLSLVFLYEFHPEGNLFTQDEEPARLFPGYILVEFSATRLAVISSCSATLAPFLTAAVMRLWRIHAVRSAQAIHQRCQLTGAQPFDISHIPHLSLLISILAGNSEALISYLRSCPRCISGKLSKSRTPLTRTIHQTALALFFFILLVLGIWISDTVFHTFTETVSIQKVTASPNVSEFGHQLIDDCQHFDRSKNSCLPCTLDLKQGNLTEQDYVESQRHENEVFRLRTNVSEISQIQNLNSELSIIRPNSARVLNGIEYEATTVGISAECRPITGICRPDRLKDVLTYTMFNCSDTFHGIIGKAPVNPINQYFTNKDPDTPPLNLKPSPYLQFGFYQDEDLSITYNPVNYNTSAEGWAIDYGDSSATACPSDSALLEMVYMGVAGRFSTGSMQAGIDLDNDTGLYSIGEFAVYNDFVFGCSLEAFEVDYIWTSNAVRSYSTRPVNGSVLNMYVSQLRYYSASAGDDMTTDLLHMALGNNSTDMARRWARLFTNRVLGVIGAYTVPRENSQQQTRAQVLVAKVHIAGLAMLVGFNGVYVLSVSIIILTALYFVSRDPSRSRLAEDMSFEEQMKQLLESKPSTRLNTSASGGTMSSEGTLINESASSVKESDERPSTSQGSMSQILIRLTKDHRWTY